MTLALELHSGSPPTDLKPGAGAVLCSASMLPETAAAIRAMNLPTWVRLGRDFSPEALKRAHEQALQALGRVDVAVLQYPEVDELASAWGSVPVPGLECAAPQQVQSLPGLRGIVAELHPLQLQLETALLGASVEVMLRLPAQRALFHAGPEELRRERARVAERLEAAFPDFRGHLDWLFLHFARDVSELVAVDPSELESLQLGLQVPPPDPRAVRRVALGLAVLDR